MAVHLVDCWAAQLAVQRVVLKELPLVDYLVGQKVVKMAVHLAEKMVGWWEVQ